MKITTKVADLKTALGTTGVCLGKNSTISCLNRVLLAGRSGMVLAYGSNGTQTVCTVPANSTSDADDQVTIAPSVILPVLSASKDDADVIIDVQKDKVVLTSGKLRMEAPRYDDDANYPLPPTKQLGEGVDLELVTLRAVEHAIPNQSNNALMTTCCVRLGDSVVAAGLDGHRVSIHGGEYNKNAEAMLIPVAAVNHLIKIFGVDATVKAIKDDDKVWVTNGQTIYITSLNDGEYFPIEQMLDESGIATRLVFNKADLLRELKPFLAVKKNMIVFDVTDKVVASATNDDKVSLTNTLESLSEVKPGGTPMKLGVNPEFIVQALSNVPDDEIELGLTNPKAPMHLIGENYWEVILPINIGE